MMPGRWWESASLAVSRIATEWSGGSVINLGGLPGSTASIAHGINDAGQVVGYSLVGGAADRHRVERRQRHRAGRPAGLHRKFCLGINDAGQVVGSERRRRRRLTPPSGAAAASSIWEACRAPQIACLPASTMPGRWSDSALSGATVYATEWSGGSVINLGSCRASRIAVPPPSTTPGRWWDQRVPPAASPSQNPRPGR